MKIISKPPQLVSKGQRGIWRVIVYHTNNNIHYKDYKAFTMNEAKRKYLIEFGKIKGKIDIKLLKTLDKQPKV